VRYRLATVRGELDTDLAASVALYEQALAEPALEPLLEARIHSDLAWLAIFVSDVSYGVRHASLAVTIAGRHDSPRTLAEAVTALSFVRTIAGEPWNDDVLEPALALEAAGERFRIDRCPSLVAGSRLLWRGDLEAARLRFESVRTMALERGDETNVSLVHYHLAHVALHGGSLDEAVDHVREAAQLAEQTGVNVTEIRLARALVGAHGGQVEAALGAATHVLAAATVGRDPMNALRALAVLGSLELSRGRGSEAHAHLARALELGGGLGLGEPGLLRFVPDLVEALLSIDRPADAQEALACFERAARRLGHPWALAALDRCRGLIRAATGDVVGGLADLERARDSHGLLPLPVERARTLLALGTVERRARRRREARASLHAALELFEHAGATLWADRARAELGRIGGRAPAGRELTAGERRVAELVATGSTNREVAAALFISVNTVEAALTRIYGKIGVRSRTELANRLLEAERKL
jgi:DNA-binding CsgD family transcriptional regulator